MSMTDDVARRHLTPAGVAGTLDEVLSQYLLGHDQQSMHLLEVLIEALEDNLKTVVPSVSDKLIGLLIKICRWIDTDEDYDIIRGELTEIIGVLRTADR